MNYSSLALAALGGTVAYFAFGFLLVWLVPALINESRKYPDVFRSKEKIMAVMPIGMGATLIAILVVAVIFAMIHQGGSGTTEGARLGVLIGIFVVCGFVLHNYVNLNIGPKLALAQAVAYFVQWTIVGIVIGLIYKPLASPQLLIYLLLFCVRSDDCGFYSGRALTMLLHFRDNWPWVRCYCLLATGRCDLSGRDE
jgi:hypothetical protein